MITENDAILRLSNWFKLYGWKVYQDKKNDIGNLCFHVKGESTEKPDLIVLNPFRNINIAIEVKSGENSRELSSPFSKLVKYFENYNEKKTFYFDENNCKILLNFFVLGTYWSMEGRLKQYEHLHIDSPRGSKKGWTRLDSVDFGCCPKIEYDTTFNITRHGVWFHIDNDKHRIYDTGIGTLLSTVLDNNGCKPAIHIKKPKTVWKKGEQKRYWRTIWIPY